MRRICLVGVVATAAPLAVAVAAWPGVSPAATRHGAKPNKVTKVTCNLALEIQAPAGELSVTPAAPTGTRFGTVQCGKSFGSGVEQDSFTLLTDGNVQGKYRQYFGTGTLQGTFMLLPADSSPSTSSTFSAQSYTGTYNVTGGTGSYRKAKGKGTISCSTPDSVHLSCREKLRVTVPS